MDKFLETLRKVRERLQEDDERGAVFAVLDALEEVLAEPDESDCVCGDEACPGCCDIDFDATEYKYDWDNNCARVEEDRRAEEPFVDNEPPDLIKYVRDRNGKLRGCLLALKCITGTVRVGWSFCHKHDQFSKKMAKRLACQRAFNIGNEVEVPRRIAKEFPEFIRRCKRFFKTEEVF